jgi:hypothetical protein
MDENFISWIQIITILGSNLVIMLTFFGISITLYISLSNSTSQTIIEIRKEIGQIRNEISELYHCVKDHHARLCVLEEKKKDNKGK